MATVGQNELENRCFICLGEDKLQVSEIHCGKTYFHPKCINKYCKEGTGIKCPICKVDISDKFNVENKRVLRPSFICETGLSNKQLAGIFLFVSLSLICASFAVYSKLPTHIYLHKLIWFYVCACVYVPFTDYYLSESSSGIGYTYEMGGFWSWINYLYIGTFVPFVFLLLGCISAIDADILSSNDVGKGTLYIISINYFLSLSICCILTLIWICIRLKQFYHFIKRHCVYSCNISCYSDEPVYVVRDAVNANDGSIV